MTAKNFIRIKGARVHNLKNISLDIPRDKLVVLTGLSGSGKSSLAFDTIYAEGQRRYVESLSSYARQFLQMQDKPDVDLIEGLSPAISIEQKTTSKNPRSTVATVTEIYDYLRLLFARAGTPYCYNCNNPIESKAASQIVDEIFTLKPNSKLSILAPIVIARKGEFKKELYKLKEEGFVRVRIDGEMRLLEEDIILNPKVKHNVEVVIDRVVLEDSSRMRISESVELSLKKAQGLVLVIEHNGTKKEPEHLYSERFSCINCGVSYPEIEPRIFSFNAPQGACGTCSGLGRIFKYSAYDRRDEDEQYIASEICPTCKGARLRKESCFIKINQKSIVEVVAKSIGEAAEFFKNVKLAYKQEQIAKPVLKEINSRLEFLLAVGLDYLTLDRAAGTLSGGEAQRIRLATQIGSALVGVLYVLDEPSIGLHQRDNERLLHTLKHLRDLGNTVLVVEHDEDTILQSDYVIDMGPKAGNLGGEVVAQGTPKEIKANKSSLTGQYLARKLEIAVPKKRRELSGFYLKLVNASGNNLKNVNVSFPLGSLISVTGVSGSGKSSLIVDTLQKALSQEFYGSKTEPLNYKKIEGLDLIDKVIEIDQSPIGRTPRSNPVTYTGIFDEIRNLFSQLPEASMRGYKSGRFSFNVKGGRCESCQGGGVIRIEMNFLADVYVTCEVCNGKRFNSETLTIHYRGKNISEVLDLTIDEAREFFSAIPIINRKLETLQRVGLGYIHLGQPATTLSGGEAQRIKLSKELSKRATGRTFYILDEPTTGLHFHDVKQLIEVLQTLVDQGNTVLVIEHNLDVIKTSDWVIDLGPEGGFRGGSIIAEGTPEEVAKNPNSHTARFLKQVL